MKMLCLLVIALLLSVATAFMATPTKTISTALFAKSKAIPFLEKPEKLDGSLAGDVGFDPLGLTNTIGNMNYVAAAELKHGRVSMLAVVGFVLQQYVHILCPESNPLKAITTLGYGPNLQILSFIGVIELATWKKTFSPEGKPGDLGFDPLKMSVGKSDVAIKNMQLKEIKNGRVAMIAIIGLIAQNIATGGAPTF